ncbi:hypothetical protein ACLB2K_065785 [Fragaria x ananassa]
MVFAYALVTAGSAASVVSNLNHTNIRHTPLLNFYKSLNIFCEHITISISYTCLLLATSDVQIVKGSPTVKRALGVLTLLIRYLGEFDRMRKRNSRIATRKEGCEAHSSVSNDGAAAAGSY